MKTTKKKYRKIHLKAKLNSYLVSIQNLNISIAQLPKPEGFFFQYYYHKFSSKRFFNCNPNEVFKNWSNFHRNIKFPLNFKMHSQ